MTTVQASSHAWSRQDILALLQLIMMIVIPLISYVGRLITGRSK